MLRIGFILSLFASTAYADWSGTKGRISLESDSFLSSDYDLTEQSHYQFVGAGLRTDNLESPMQASIQGQFAPQAPLLSYLNIRELYYNEPRLSIGRKLETWSSLDDRWEMGLFNPQFRWNPLRPESQGLSGLFLRLQNEDSSFPWQITIFGSPVFIPDQGAGYSIQDKKFQAVNPWFNPPPKRIRFETGAVDDINYDVQKPNIGEIVFNPSYAARLQLGQPGDGLSFQVALASKPSNQLTLGLAGDLGVQQAVDVRVNPSFVMHSLLSADLHFENQIFEIGAGFLREKPEEPRFEDPWTYRVDGEATMWSPVVGFKWGGLRLRAMSLMMNESESRLKGPKADIFSEFPVRRYPFSNAHAVEADFRIRWKRQQGLQVKSRYTQGEKSEFDLWTLDSSYQLNDRWSLTAQFLMVRVDSEKGETLYSDFENNDSVRAGVLYVF